MWCLVISIVLEYAFLIINIIWIIKTLIQARKKAQAMMSKNKTNKNPFVVYKWANKNAYNQDKTILCRDPFAEIIERPPELKKKKKVKNKLKEGKTVEDVEDISDKKLSSSSNKVSLGKLKKV